ncbi:MBL fold metallo-hydrolase [Spongiivirga citrea]|uniref:MBL fold metallo-hydrolase n=1 Tax=Spongiivirga citrea TaxID=1481457 RepID=A0A6M0CLE2_9FLAO|nr:MBL fold metallo-hydrolase [Spongiivirga citrea]NER16669.1 MBL fold metallo-hydrolase [Spongiivirga citrea]
MRQICLTILLFSSIQLQAQKIKLSRVDSIPTENGKIAIQPIWHGTVAFVWNGTTILVDPSAEEALFENYKKPDVIIITDIHGDHFNLETLEILDTKETTFVVPKVVANKLPEKFKANLVVLKNGEDFNLFGVDIKAIPMYNFPEEKNAFHTKGRGNGYVLGFADKRIYISGDTEDIPEMRALENIDVAFIVMNMPWTMTEEQAASAVVDFKPALVYPYHYRNKDKTYSDLKKFRIMVQSSNKNIKIRQRNFYPGQ